MADPEKLSLWNDIEAYAYASRYRDETGVELEYQLLRAKLRRRLGLPKERDAAE